MEPEHLTTEWKTLQDRNKELKDFPELNENEYKAYPNLWNMKVALAGKFRALSVYMKKKWVISN